MSKQLAALAEIESSGAANAVGRAVLTALGRPADFLRVTSTRVTDTNHRVNVLVKATRPWPGSPTASSSRPTPTGT